MKTEVSSALVAISTSHSCREGWDRTHPALGGSSNDENTRIQFLLLFPLPSIVLPCQLEQKELEKKLCILPNPSNLMAVVCLGY